MLTLDNGPLNLFDQAMFDAVVADIADLTAHPPRAVLAAGRGEGRLRGCRRPRVRRVDAGAGKRAVGVVFARICHPIEALPCPVVFAAHGLTLTAAFEIALACDIVVAGPKARSGWWRRLSPSLRRWVARSGWPNGPAPAAPGNW